MGWLVGLAIVLGLYFLPTIVGASRHKRNAGAIFALNLFLGWSVIGWIISLVWALTTDEIVVISKQQPPSAPNP